jgi:glycosyltransferase involved in cell wall biosynthesis
MLIEPHPTAAGTLIRLALGSQVYDLHLSGSYSEVRLAVTERAILEASTLGVPVVASRVGGIPEVVEDGRTGLLVPPRDPVALADAIVKMLSDRPVARALAAAAKERVRDHFSSAVTAARYEALYQQLLDEKQRQPREAAR